MIIWTRLHPMYICVITTLHVSTLPSHIKAGMWINYWSVESKCFIEHRLHLSGLYSVGGRWMRCDWRAMVECYWQEKTEVLREVCCSATSSTANRKKTGIRLRGWLITAWTVAPSWLYGLLNEPGLGTGVKYSSYQWRTEGGGVGVQPPPPPKFRRPSRIVSNSTRLWKLLTIAEFRTPTPQDVRKKGSVILKLRPVRNCFTLAMTTK